MNAGAQSKQFQQSQIQLIGKQLVNFSMNT